MSALAVRPRFLRGALFFLVVFLAYTANGRRLGSHDSTATALVPFALLASPFYLPALLFPDLDGTEPVWERRIHAAFEKIAAAGLAALTGLLLRLEHDLPPPRSAR